MSSFINRTDVFNLLGQKNILTREQLELVKKKQTETGIPLEDILFESELITEEEFMKFLADQLNIPYVKIDPLKLDINVVTGYLSGPFAKKYRLLVIGKNEDVLTIAISNPFDTVPLEDIKRMTKMDITHVFSSKTDILKVINEFYGLHSSLTKAQEELISSTRLTQDADILNLEALSSLGNMEDINPGAQPVIKATNHLLSYSLAQRASDIHIEPKRAHTLVRFRIDGILHDICTIPSVVSHAIISRFKAMSGMDIAEKRRPQDGRIKISDNGKEIEIRISSMPVAFAEKLVLRIFDPEILLQDFDKLGFDNDEMNKFLKYIVKPHGIILVTGPTGSGKTTTLYSCLKILASSEKNIVTIEDPPELIFEKINQVAVKPIIGLTFAAALRTILRQDPDIIMVGEIRDVETAENAIQAALTGHLVLSTLHTNDAPSAITRLMDMKIPPFLISSTILCILAQRLMRKICPACKTKYQASDEDFAKLKIQKPDKPFFFHKGAGCSFCRKTGYYSREAIFEMMEVSPHIKDLITTNAAEEEIRKTALKEALIPLRDAALKKLSAGISTTDEMLRVMGTL